MTATAFSHVLGQERPKRLLRKAIARGKIPHAYLFTGPPGTGKTTTAMALCMALNCGENLEEDGCGQCLSCRRILNGNSPDFIVIRPEGQYTKVEKIRELNRAIGFAPFGNYRVCVISRAEAMTAEAANSFLKTLEEPPARNILVLTAIEHRDLPPTIASRCQRIAFQAMAQEDIARWLVENSGADKKNARILARVSGGSLGRAAAMASGDYREKRQDWISKLNRILKSSGEEVIHVAAECSEEAGKMSLSMSDEGAAGLLDVLGTWESWYRDLLVLLSGSSPELIMNVDFHRELQNFSEKFIISLIVDSLTCIHQAEQDLRKMANTRLVMENLVINLNRHK